MISVAAHINPHQAGCLRDEIKELDEAYWRDRSRFRVNRGLNNEAGFYYSCDKAACPSRLALMIDDVAPRIAGLDLESWVINYTPAGGFMPSHIDNEGYLAFSVLALQSGSGAFQYDRDNNPADPVLIGDRAGQLVSVTSMAQVHAVPQVRADRYVIIYLFR